MTSLQKVVLGNIPPRRCNQVRPEDLGSGGVVTVTNLLSVHLKGLNRGEDIVLMQVVNLQVGAEGGPLVV